MSTATRQPSLDQAQRKKLVKNTKRLDTPWLRSEVRKLLELELNQFESLLNKKLVSELHLEFCAWLADQQEEIDQQLKHVPREKRRKWLSDRLFLDRRRPENQPPRMLSDFLFQFANQKLRRLGELKRENQEFRKTVTKVRNDDEREQIILHYASTLGATSRQLSGDQRAFARWFGEEAVTDRYAKSVGEIELLLAFTFQRIGLTLAHIFRLSTDQHYEAFPKNDEESQSQLAKRLVALWKRLNLESRLQEALVYEGDNRVYVSVLKCLTLVLKEIPDGLLDELFEVRTLMFVHRAAMECNSEVWIQCEALNILAAISMAHAFPILRMRLESPIKGDDIFVRRHALKLIEEYLLAMPDNSPHKECDIANQLDDPSSFVRQKLAKVAFLSTHSESDSKWKALVLKDSDPKVRAAAVMCPAEVACEPLRLFDSFQMLVESLENELDPFVLRTTMWTAIQLLTRLINAHPESELQQSKLSILNVVQGQLVPALNRLEVSHEDIPLRRWAAQTREQLWALQDPLVQTIINRLGPRLKKIKPGKSKRFPKSWFRRLSREKLGRVFAVIAQDDFGYDLQFGLLGVRISRGPSFGFRLWRWLYECTHLATDKRQGISHTCGRISTSTLRAPSQILGELSETKVPGEPLTIAADGTWRPFLPLVDDFVSILNMSWVWPRTVNFHTSQGRTQVTGPKWIWQRVRAAWELNFKFKRFADLRNWDEESNVASSYVEAMSRLGFHVQFESRSLDDFDSASVDSREANIDNPIPETLETDSSVSKFFAAAVAAIPCTPLLGQALFESPFWRQIQRFIDYFSSAFENTLEELVVFAGLVLLFVVGKHLLSNWSFRKARAKIPLSIGGWGTRGKSGTERLKAALIGVMGHGIVSKTTGCEAMFIHSHAFGEPLEIPLFRPYDKATIWEHRNLIVLASQMNPSVFLWECMALNPDYVNVLQRQWTQDDIATITNTYPDHEDVQGPAGHNVATTISGFVPLNSHLISTEQVMRPYVTESCRRAGTTFEGVGWLESGLVTDDILDRFPYQEHPDNIALVAKMGMNLGVDYEFSLKAMADYLVPDLGVLKTHPISNVRNREIEFTNGMSANERFGCMGNWKRLEFDQQDPWKSPCTWVCGVVNNRADRVPRSKVFAKILVEDIHADRHFLIGSNLKGLQGFINEAWEDHEQSFTLIDHEGIWKPDYALEILHKTARDFRQPIEEAHIVDKVRGMIIGCVGSAHYSQNINANSLALEWEAPVNVYTALEAAGVSEAMVASLKQHIIELKTSLEEYRELEQVIQSTTPDDATRTDDRFREVLKTWFFRKLIVVENYNATGEEVIRTIVDSTPPGFRNRLMGLQNIKGTGLDFVYRFQAWDVCRDACEAMASKQSVDAERGLQALVSMPEIGQLCQNLVREAIQIGRRNPDLQRADLQALIDQLESKLADKSLELPSGEATPSNKSAGEWNQWLLKMAEEFLDVSDSIKRRNLADSIYDDLANQRISRQRAVVELRKINKRQKGGWLIDQKKT
jgi:poly-gamma-glutamate synthase PgsB/CapB